MPGYGGLAATSPDRPNLDSGAGSRIPPTAIRPAANRSVICRTVVSDGRDLVTTPDSAAYMIIARAYQPLDANARAWVGGADEALAWTPSRG